MAVSTRDIVIDIDNFNQNVTYKTGQGTAIYFIGKSRADLVTAINNGTFDLLTDGISLIVSINGHSLILENYIRQNGSNSFKYIKTDEENGETFLLDIIGSSLINLPNGYGTIVRGNTVTGTAFGDVINVSDYYTYGRLVINGGKGNDVITGSGYPDTINAGDGDDIINDSIGGDIMTGGAGHNIIRFTSINYIDGDKINLTKGEQLEIDISAAINQSSSVTYKVNGRDLDIIFRYYGYDRKITLVNSGISDITYNGTARQENTGYVKIITTQGVIDLRKDELPQISVDKNYTGAWLNENISASEYIVRDSWGLENYANTRGLTLKGGNGNDKLTGSKYNDTLKGQDGNDILIGGTGSNLLGGNGGDDIYIISMSDGSFNEILYEESGNDTVIIQGVKNDIALYYQVWSLGEGFAGGTVYIKNRNSITEDIGAKHDLFNYEGYEIETTIINNNTDNENDDYIWTYDEEQINTITSEVASWLTTNNYGSVEDVINGGNETDINSVLAIFDQVWQPRTV